MTKPVDLTPTLSAERRGSKKEVFRPLLPFSLALEKYLLNPTDEYYTDTVVGSQAQKCYY